MQSLGFSMPPTWRPSPLQAFEPLVERAHRALLDAICEGRLAPGERITQEGLGELLGVSRQPISQALALLKQQGFVRDAPGRGLEVAPIEQDRLRAVFEVRGAIDALAAASAARRALADPTNFAASLDRLDGVVAAGRNAVDRADLPALVSCDVAFHQLLAELSGNPVVVEITLQQWSHIRRVIAIALEDPTFHRRCWNEHAAMADAIRAGRAEDAADIARGHCEVAARETRDRLRNLAASQAA
jgi:DNA-binding GntR family transcriptional regulator